jgi:hypothetical protein
MVISVLERRAEIGLRRSLGATHGQVRTQFLVESLLLSGLGVGNLFEEQKVFDVVVWGAPGIRQSGKRTKQLSITKEGSGLLRWVLTSRPPGA